MYWSFENFTSYQINNIWRCEILHRGLCFTDWKYWLCMQNARLSMLKLLQIHFKELSHTYKSVWNTDTETTDPRLSVFNEGSSSMLIKIILIIIKTILSLDFTLVFHKKKTCTVWKAGNNLNHLTLLILIIWRIYVHEF